MSPVLNLSPKVRQVHQEHVESSEPLVNNTAVLEMLKAMARNERKGQPTETPTVTQG